MFQHFLDLQLVGEHQYSASLLYSHDTDTRATMNMAVGNGVIAAGQDGTCCLMRFKHCTQREGGRAAAKDGEAYCYNLIYTCCLIKNIQNMLFILHLFDLWLIHLLIASIYCTCASLLTFEMCCH